MIDFEHDEPVNPLRVTAQENERDIAEWEADAARALREARKELAARLSPATLAILRQAGCQV